MPQTSYASAHFPQNQARIFDGLGATFSHRQSRTAARVCGGSIPPQTRASQWKCRLGRNKSRVVQGCPALLPRFCRGTVESSARNTIHGCCLFNQHPALLTTSGRDIKPRSQLNESLRRNLLTHWLASVEGWCSAAMYLYRVGLEIPISRQISSTEC